MLALLEALSAGEHAVTRALFFILAISGRNFDGLCYHVGMRYMGVDYGTKRVGIALSDEEGKMAFPCAILENNKGLMGEIKNICAKEGVQNVVIGESLNYQGAPNRVMKEIKSFVAEMEEVIGVPVILEREFLSTQQARFFQEEKKHVDDSAAAIILQSYLDRKNSKSIREIS